MTLRPEEIFRTERRFVSFIGEGSGSPLLTFECDENNEILDIDDYDDHAVFEILMNHRGLWEYKDVYSVHEWVCKLLAVYSLDENYDTANAWFNTYIALEGLK